MGLDEWRIRARTAISKTHPHPIPPLEGEGTPFHAIALGGWGKSTCELSQFEIICHAFDQ
jgi:hypothetical protein